MKKSGRARRDQANSKDTLKYPFRVHVFALRRGFGPSAERFDAPLAGRAVILREGESARLDVLVENVGIGHDYPAGAQDMRDVWLEVEMVAPPARRLLASLSPKGPVHRYGAVCLDRLGREVHHVNLASAVAVVHLPVIPAGGADVARYRFTVPAEYHGLAGVYARLRERTSSGVLTLAEDYVHLAIQDREGRFSVSPLVLGGARDDPGNASLFFAYGGALLRQNDIPQARRAFKLARSLAPNDPENWIALARTYIEEGDRLSARDHLRRALTLSPDSDRAKAWLGYVYREMGDYNAALDLLRPLAERHPADRDVWFDLGTCLFQMGRYEEAIEPFRRVLGIDPDDVAGHFNLMRCYRSLRRVTEARLEETVYHELSDEGSATEVVQRYLQSHPADRRESQRIHEHVLTPEPSGSIGSRR